jgi:hypothetical protein
MRLTSPHRRLGEQAKTFERRSSDLAARQGNHEFPGCYLTIEKLSVAGSERSPTALAAVITSW